MKKTLTLLVLILALVAITDTQAYGQTAVYSNAYDGFTNIREAATTRSEILGRLPNGDECAYVINSNGNWYYVHYRNIYGYVSKSQVSYYPSERVNLDITAEWLNGVWYGPDSRLTLDTRGNFVYRNDYGKERVGTWRLSGGNYITLTGSWDGWTESYYINLSNYEMGPYSRIAYVEEEAPVTDTQTSSRDMLDAENPAVYKAIDSEDMSDSELSKTLYTSTTGELPMQYRWMIGEWSAQNGQYVAIISDDEIRTYNRLKGGDVPASGRDIKASEYTIRYKHSNKLQCYFMVLTPVEDIPEVYINCESKEVFFINREEAISLARTGDLQNYSIWNKDTLLIGGIILSVIAAVVSIIVSITLVRKSRKAQ